jgi:SNF2 family DNA or RNA helicase
MLSGTPLLNRPIELWPILYYMAPELIDFMPYQDFGFKYGGATINDFGKWQFLGSSNEEDLNQRIMGRFMQRIKKEDVLKDLPPKVREVIFIDDTRAKDVQALDKSLLKRFKDKDSPRMELGEYAEIRHINGLAKVDWASRFVSDILKYDSDEQIILYAHHRDVVQNLSSKLSIFKPQVINGGVKDIVRTQIQDAFQSGKCRLLIGNIDAMNLGLTLTKATRIIFCEYAWTPSANEQAEDRANRIGSLWSIFCQYLVYPDSIDEKILTSNIIKEERIKKVIG